MRAAPLFTAAVLAVAALLPLQARALQGKELTLQGAKGSALLVAVEDGGAHWLSLKDAVLHAGARVTWKSTPRMVTVEHGGSEYRLAVGHPFLYVGGGRRVALESGLQWRRGELLLSAPDLERLLREMGFAGIQLADADPADLKRPVPTPQKGEGEEPRIQHDPEPVLVPSGPTPPASPRGPLKVVVIDPGHGGRDSGALGRRKTKEKDVCLDIARRLRGFIERHEKGVKVIMTRDKDVFVSLEKRAQIANDAGADLFISIHNNAATDRRARGTQVFFYDSQSSTRHAARLARSENSDANLLDVVFTDLLKTQVREDSIEMAALMQKHLAKVLNLKTRRLHYAPFYVLAQTKMPSVLVEAAFLSNPDEEALLGKSAFREQVALGIFRGLRGFKEAYAAR